MKVFDKNLNSFLIKTPSKGEIEGNFLSLGKGIYKNPIILKDGREHVPPKIGT